MNLLGGSLPVGRLFGIHIRIHMLFVVWMAFNLVQAGDAWPQTLTFLGMIFLIVLIHEFGHCFGARLVGGDAENIMLWPLGGLAYAEAPMRPWPQFVTIAAGPVVHPILCVVSASVLVAATGHWGFFTLDPFRGPIGITETWQFYVWLFYKLNLILLYFNLLPIFPMDGGQLFRAILWPWLGLQRATILATQVGLVGAIVLAYVGIQWGNILLVMIAAFGAFSSFQHLRFAQAGMLREDSVYDRLGQNPAYDTWWRKMFRIRRPRRTTVAPGPATQRATVPAQAAVAVEERFHEDEAELDRILKKVSSHGIGSLTYIEQQRLERITRARRREP